MSKILHVFDVSPFIHAGHVNKASKLETVVNIGTTWKTQVTPTGGTSLLFNTLYEVAGTGDCVFCCDRRPTIKQEMLPGYKASRAHRREIEVEKGACEYILEKCNCSIIARAGYEADDIIYSIIKAKHDEYDKIYIYTGDSDLYFLVDEVVSIRPSSSRAKTVTLENFKESTGCDYNLITVKKIIFGDSSDEIPGIPKEDRKMLHEFFYKEQFVGKLGNKEFVKSWMDYMFPQYSSRVDLVFPLQVDDIPTDFKPIDKRMLINFGDSINNRCFRNRAEQTFNVNPYIKELQEMGLYIEED